ncbi:MAG: hypothetical protein ACI80I_000578, partial [Akkermansiaceae bacterium]
PDNGSMNAILMFSAKAALAPKTKESADTAPSLVMFFILILPRTARRFDAFYRMPSLGWSLA